jgi:hypothetical protein
VRQGYEPPINLGFGATIVEVLTHDALHRMESIFWVDEDRKIA